MFEVCFKCEVIGKFVFVGFGVECIFEEVVDFFFDVNIVVFSFDFFGLVCVLKEKI